MWTGLNTVGLPLEDDRSSSKHVSRYTRWNLSIGVLIQCSGHNTLCKYWKRGREEVTSRNPVPRSHSLLPKCKRTQVLGFVCLFYMFIITIAVIRS
jgi:hypothetical protein